MSKKASILPAEPPLAFSILEFARAYRVSRATIYNLWKSGAGPARMYVRGRVLISRVAAEDWRKQVEGFGEAKQ